ncbi:hypothetical protein ACE6H2_016623 [Prunus campanulata]
MAEIDEAVTRMVFESYGVKKYHDDHFRLAFHNLRLIKYKVAEKLGGGVVLRSHTDKTFSPSSIGITSMARRSIHRMMSGGSGRSYRQTITTILHQNHVNGLEINTKDNEWIGFDLLPSSCLFLAGGGYQISICGRIVRASPREQAPK